MNKKDNVFTYIEGVSEVRGKVQGKDFQVVSMFVLDDDLNAYSLEGFLKLRSPELAKQQLNLRYDQHEVRKVLQEKKLIRGHMVLNETIFPMATDKDFVFYKLNEPLDIGLLTELGMGVVRMLTGEFAGELMVFFPFYGTHESDDLDEIIILKMYLQLKHPEVYFKGLDYLFEEHADKLESLILTNVEAYMNRLGMIFNNYNKKQL